MADETHELDINADRLLAEVRTLRIVVETILAQLPDRAIDAVVSDIELHSIYAEGRAQATQDKRWARYAASASDVAEGIKETGRTVKEDRAEGTRISTIPEIPDPHQG